MMGTSSSPVTFVEQLIPQMLAMVDQAKAQAFVMIWNITLTFLKQNLLWVILILTTLLLFSFLIALTGRWGMFGSLLYNYFYFGSLLVIGLIWGPAIFANDYFEIVTVILYIICFSLVGWVLSATHLRRKY